MRSSYAVCYIGQVDANKNATCSQTCIPGIPCINYDIDDEDGSSNPAGSSAQYNGPKSGDKVDSAAAGDPHEVTSCDGNFMNQIFAKAYMNASREVILSEQIIHKPDSVLEYTCFDHQIGLAARYAPTFSESSKWDAYTVTIATADDDNGVTDTEINPRNYSDTPDDNLENLLEDLMLDTLEEYITKNFAHTFLGGAMSIDNNMSLTSISSGNSCSHMATIWELAKCIEFAEDDAFRSYQHLVHYDPRSIPAACSPGHVSSDAVDPGDKINDRSGGSSIPTSLDALNSSDNFSGGLTVDDITKDPNSITDPPIPTQCPPAGGPISGVNTGFSNDLIRVANNCDTTDLEYAYSDHDEAEMYFGIVKGLGLYYPGAGAGTSTTIDAGLVQPVSLTGCPGLPIPTGIPVITHQYTTGLTLNYLSAATRISYIHYDHVCPNAGCFYTPLKQLYSFSPTLTLPTFDSFTNVGVCLPTGLSIP